MPVGAPAGYRKRRQRSTHQARVYHQAHPPQSQAPPVRPSHQLREEVLDEMNMINVKQQASKKFSINHDLLENVTSKYVPVDSIIPTNTFPGAMIQGVKYSHPPEKEENSTSNRELMDREELILKSKLSNLFPDDVFFGDLKLMKLKLKMLEEENKNLEIADASGYNFGDEYRYQSSKTDELSNVFGTLETEETFKNHSKMVDDIITKDYSGEKFEKYIKEKKGVVIFGQPTLLKNKVTKASLEDERRKQEEIFRQQQEAENKRHEELQKQQMQAQQLQQQQMQPQPQIPAEQSQQPPAQSFVSNHPPAVGSGDSVPQIGVFDQPSFVPTKTGPVGAALSPEAQTGNSSAQKSPEQLTQPPLDQVPQQPTELPQHDVPQQPPQGFPNAQLDNFGIFPPNDPTDKDLFGDTGADDLLMDDGAFNGLQSTLEDQIFFDHSLE